MTPAALELDTVTLRWQRAFDASDHALAAAGDLLPAAALQQERRPDPRPAAAGGVAAGHAAGLAVIGVASGAQAELLHGFGAETLVPGLSALLDRRLAQ